MAMRRPKPEMPSSSSPPPPPPSDQRDAVIQELRMGAQLAEFLRQQVELIPELDRRDAALANVGDISTALTSSLSVLQSERDIQQYCSSSDAGAAAHAPRALGGGSVGARNGAVARNRKAKHRRGRHGEELPIKEILTETPENDRFHWRKYGEKKILNAAFPRLYYRCGYSDEHKCPAKKYVQQQNNSDPPLFLVTLINDHTCETLFPADQPHCSSSSANSQVLDFTKASLSSPIMAAPAAGVLRLKKEEDVGMSVTIPSYAYDNQLPSSLPFLSPKQWEMEMDIKGIFRQDSGDGNLSS